MALSNLRKSIFFLQQAIREEGTKNNRDLLDALGLMVKVENKNSDVNDPNHYNTTGI